MRRGGLYRFSDRHSYKPSEVAALFIFGLVSSGLIVGICMAVNMLIDRFFGRT